MDDGLYGKGNEIRMDCCGCSDNSVSVLHTTRIRHMVLGGGCRWVWLGTYAAGELDHVLGILSSRMTPQIDAPGQDTSPGDNRLIATIIN